MSGAAPDQPSGIRDSSTDLFTAGFFQAYLDIELHRARRYGRPCALLAIRIDGLTALEGRLGAAVHGDVPRRIAAALTSGEPHLRRSDIVARFEHDVLVVILPETTVAGAEVKAERIRQAITRIPWAEALPGLGAPPTISVGVVCHPAHADSAPELLRAALQAEALATGSGGNQVRGGPSRQQVNMTGGGLGYWIARLGWWNTLLVLPPFLWHFVIHDWLVGKKGVCLTDDLDYRENTEGFDNEHGTDTRERESPRDIDDKAGKDSFGYAPTPTGVLTEALAGLPVAPQDYVLIDAGAGKGRALLMAAKYPFTRVLGLELSPSLVKVCLENIEKFSKQQVLAVKPEIECADVSTYRMPRANLVVFMFAPFGFDTFDAMMSELEEVVHAGRKLVLVWVGRPPLYIRKYRRWIKQVKVIKPRPRWTVSYYASR